jgi:hypothetical protein
MALNMTLQMLIGSKAGTTLLHSGFIVGAFGWLRSLSFESEFTPIVFLARGDQESTFIRLDLDMYRIDMCLEMRLPEKGLIAVFRIKVTFVFPLARVRSHVFFEPAWASERLVASLMGTIVFCDGYQSAWNSPGTEMYRLFVRAFEVALFPEASVDAEAGVVEGVSSVDVGLDCSVELPGCSRTLIAASELGMDFVRSTGAVSSFRRFGAGSSLAIFAWCVSFTRPGIACVVEELLLKPRPPQG